MKIKTKTMFLFISFIFISLAVTVIFVIKTADHHFSKQVEKLLISQADYLSQELNSFQVVSSELNKYTARDIRKLLDNEVDAVIDTSERVATAYELAGEGEMAVSFRIMDIVAKKTVGKSGFTFALEPDGFLSVPPKKKFKKGYQKTFEAIVKDTSKTYTIPFKRRGEAVVYCKPYERFKIVVCAAIPEAETSAGAAFIKRYAKETFETFVKNEKVAETGYYYLINPAGKVLIHPEEELIGKSLADKPFIKEVLEKRDGSLRYRWNGRSKLAGFAYIEPLDAILVGGAPSSEFLGSIKKDLIFRPVVVGIIVIIVATALMNILFNRTIVSPIKRLGLFIEKISSGDLTSECRLTYKDEIGTIGNYLNGMTENISETLCDVQSSAHNVKEHSGSLQSSGIQLSDAIKAQSERTSNVERSIQDILHSFDQISGDMQELSREINHIKDSAQEGNTVLNNTVQGISNLAETVISTSDTIDNLGQSSKHIIEIVKVISDIADQTNLLALNAAIEAARAGEHGRGFAVVADEVRKLAERTVTATSEINEMTAGISKDVTKSVIDMQRGAELAKDGESLASELKISLSGIINGVVEAANKIESVSAAITQQNTSSQKISEDSAEIAGFSKKNADIASSNREQAEMLNNLASKLLSTVDRFRLKCDTK